MLLSRSFIMGNFKMLYIKYLNLDKEQRELIKAYSKEYIYDAKEDDKILKQNKKDIYQK